MNRNNQQGESDKIKIDKFFVWEDLEKQLFS